jgi:hypothetical protein
VVLVVANRGECRLYPLRMMHALELVCDTVGGKTVLITYCGLTYSPVVYESSGELDVTSLTDAGFICENNLVLEDQRTGTLWRQINGEALAGPLSGRRLKEHPSCVGVLAAVLTAMPHATLMAPCPAGAGPVRRLQVSANGLPVDLRPELEYPVSRLDARLPLKERVLGFQVGTVAMVMPFAPPAWAYRTNSVGRTTWRVQPGLGLPAVEILSEGGGWEPLKTQACFWFAWYELHPETGFCPLAWARLEALKPVAGGGG